MGTGEACSIFYFNLAGFKKAQEEVQNKSLLEKKRREVQVICKWIQLPYNRCRVHPMQYCLLLTFCKSSLNLFSFALFRFPTAGSKLVLYAVVYYFSSTSFHCKNYKRNTGLRNFIRNLRWILTTSVFDLFFSTCKNL